MTLPIFACGLTAGLILDLLLLRTLLAPPFRIWPTPEPGSWQSLTFWGLFRGGMVATFVVASVEGSFGLAKNAKSAPLLRENLEVLTDFLDSLRATPATKRRR